MKHSNTGNKSLLKIKKKTSLSIPKSPSGCSANWKDFLNEMNDEKATSKVQKHKSHFKKKKKFKFQNIIIKKEDLWFDGITESDILLAEKGKLLNKTNFENSNPPDKIDIRQLTKALAIDCEMVGTGFQGQHSALARVSLVDENGKCVYDKYVKPQEEVTDYRTHVSGITPTKLLTAEAFSDVQKQVADMIKDKVLVGHALWNDLKVLMLTHPKKLRRDTAKYQLFQSLSKKRNPSLKLLCHNILGVQIQQKQHSSVEDCQAVMKLYLMHKKQWENDIKSRKWKTDP